MGLMEGTTEEQGLTPAGIANAVWNALLANYSDAGSAGKALSTASSGGVDLDAMAAAVWAYAARTLSAGEVPSEAAIAAEILAAAQITPIHADMRKTVGQALHGDGTESDKFRSTLVP